MKRCPKCKAKLKTVLNGQKCNRCGWSKYEPEKKSFWEFKWLEW